VPEWFNRVEAGLRTGRTGALRPGFPLQSLARKSSA